MNKYQELLNFILQTLKEGKGLVIDNMPQIAKEIIHYQTIETSMLAIIFIALFIITIIAFIVLIKVFKEDEDVRFGISFIFIIALSIIGACSVANVKKLIKIKTAPTVVIIEEIKDMMSCSKEG